MSEEMNMQNILPENTSNENITNVEISGEMKKRFLEYAMSVIVARALPDVRDGLKPVSRRIQEGDS